MPILCEQAHSPNAVLRLNALWALKHVIHDAGVEFRQNCLMELNPQWLVSLICDDDDDEEEEEDFVLYSGHRRSNMDEDVDMSASEDDNGALLSGSTHATSSTSTQRDAQSDVHLFRLAQQKLNELRSKEASEHRKARHEDVAIQEQGLSLIRNLIASAHAGTNADGANDTAQMIDHLFEVIGQECLFNIMSSKLQSRVSQPLGRKGIDITKGGSTGGDGGSRVVPPHGRLIVAVIYILVHMAASLPRHRQLVITQTELLRSLSKMFNSQNREVRLALCHLINNLTWQDDGSDATACSQRAVELRKLGFLTKLEALNQTDEELDVREQARSALWQMKHGY